MALLKSRYKSNLSETKRTKLLEKIRLLYAQKTSRVVFDKRDGTRREIYLGHALESLVIDETQSIGTIVLDAGPRSGAGAAATALLNLTADITLTSVAPGSLRNDSTFTLQVLAAAANPTDTVLVAFTGTESAIVCTVTPNDGTNNAATPVGLTTAELRELISTGAVVGKNITLTDASSLRALQTATGGGATALADAGEGDGVAATFAAGDDVQTFDAADVVDIRRLRTKKYKIVLAP